MFDPLKSETFVSQIGSKKFMNHVLERDVPEDAVLLNGDVVTFLTATDNMYAVYSTQDGVLFHFHGWAQSLGSARRIYRKTCQLWSIQ